MTHKDTREFDLTIIGAGLAGMAAGLFAARRGLSVAQVGGKGGLSLSSGHLDLLGVHPVEEGRCWHDPWAGLEALKADGSPHPLARMEAGEIRESLDEVLAALDAAGLPYRRDPERNIETVTLLGTVKLTHAVPSTLWNGVTALAEKRPCLLVGFQGLKEFNAGFIAKGLKEAWPELRFVRLSFPGTEKTSRIYTQPIARQMELREVRESLALSIRRQLRPGETVGFPAVFGIHRSPEVVAAFEEAIEAPLFEIPTLPASVAGIRLKETFESILQDLGVHTCWGEKVGEVRHEGSGPFTLTVGDGAARREIRSRGVILATGRFFGKGLYADRHRIRETLFDLPVHQPESRNGWHHRDLMDPRGHPVNRAGLETDDAFRPLDADGRPAFPTLFASGSILAHQDWTRMKCGAGSSIATSFAAVKHFLGGRG